MKKIGWLVVILIVAAFIIFAIAFDVYGMKVVTKDEHDALIEKIKVMGYTDLEIAEIFGDERVILLMPRISKRLHVSGYFSPESKLFQPESIRCGREILKEKMEVLKKAERMFGVKKEILLAVFRLETNFGRYIGRDLVFNSLYRVFVFKERQWGEEELLHYLRLCKLSNYDPLTIFGSDMGAFGLFQFLPSSFINFARDWNGDGKVDLFSFEDAIFSAASYLRFFGCNKKNLAKTKAAIYAYNHDWAYVKALLAYAETLQPGFDNGLLNNLDKLRRFVERKYGFKK